MLPEYPKSFEDLKGTCPLAFLGTCPEPIAAPVTDTVLNYLARPMAHTGRELNKPVTFNWPPTDSEVPQDQHQLLFDKEVQVLVVYLPTVDSCNMHVFRKPTTPKAQAMLKHQMSTLKNIFNNSHPELKLVLITDIPERDIAKSDLPQQFSRPNRILVLPTPFDIETLGYFVSPDLDRKTIPSASAITPELIAARLAELRKNE